jgi:hypothetical protein
VPLSRCKSKLSEVFAGKLSACEGKFGAADFRT